MERAAAPGRVRAKDDPNDAAFARRMARRGGSTMVREQSQAADRAALTSIYRCDAEMRVSEVMYSDHYDDVSRFIGGTDFDWLPQEEAEAVMALKWRAARERRVIRDTMPLTVEGRPRTFRLAVYPEMDADSKHSITVIAMEILDPDAWLRSLDLPYQTTAEPQMPRFGTVRMDNTTRTLLGPVRNVHLSGTEWRLVRQLSNAHGGVVSHEELLSSIWGSGYSNAHHLLHDAVSRLRHRFHAAGLSKSPIETVHGVGYRLREEGEVF
jgi:DNA-binding response OmpR family regulator